MGEFCVKVIVAMDSFKGSLTALEACTAFEKGMKKVFSNIEIVKVPIADGGEGTVQSLVDATRGRMVFEQVTGPLGDKVDAFYGILGDGKTAVIEMAAASGLPLVPKEKRNPLVTTTYGTGELIKKALDQGCQEFYLGVGGSATNDGGMGMAQALGIKFLDREGRDIGFGGGSLKNLYRIDMSNRDTRLEETKITVLCDVDNPLCGEQGASYVFGPQKGASQVMVQELDKGLRHFAEIIKRDLRKDILEVKGAGAAGGLGGGFIAFFDSVLKSGIEVVIEKSKLSETIQGSDLVITGEGKIDGQTIHGKTPIGVAKVAQRWGIPVIAVVGGIGQGAEAVHNHGIDAVFSIVPAPMSLEEAMNPSQAAQLMKRSAEEISRLIRIIK